MIEPAKLDEENFIVLIPDLKPIKKVTSFREFIANHYNLYDENCSPELHLTIDRIKKDKSKQAVELLEKIVTNTDAFKICINNFECIEFNDTFLTVSVDRTKPLVNLANNVHQQLKGKEISTIETYSEWKFHITLINNNFSKKSIPQKEFKKICSILNRKANSTKTKIKRLEVWKPTLEPSEKVIASFDFD